MNLLYGLYPFFFCPFCCGFFCSGAIRNKQRIDLRTKSRYYTKKCIYISPRSSSRERHNDNDVSRSNVLSTKRQISMSAFKRNIFAFFLSRMNENRNNSFRRSSALVRTCTNCCPYDTKNLPHPLFNYSSIDELMMNQKTDTCCLSKLQVECHIQHPKKKRKRYQSSLSIKRSISSANQFIPHRKRKRFHSDDKSDTQISSPSSSTNASSLSEQSFSSNHSEKVYPHDHRSTSTIFE